MKRMLLGASLVLMAPVGAAQEIQEQPLGGENAFNPVLLKPGLVGEYWHVGRVMKEFPEEVLGRAPYLCRIDGMIDFDAEEGRGFGDLPWKQYFAVLWKGIIRLPLDGEYTFYLRSQDGSKLYLDGALIVDHVVTYQPREASSKSVLLKAGDHDLKIKYFQNKEGQCTLGWKYDGIAQQTIPSTRLWHKFDKEVDPEAK